MPRLKLDRRSFLRGACGTLVALPFLECMTPTAKAGTPSGPSRFFVGFCGTSTGGQFYTRERGVWSGDCTTPAATGAGWESTVGLAAIDAHGVREDVAIVSGLEIPWETSSGIPAAGRQRKWHDSPVGPLLSGQRSSDDDSVRSGFATAATCDQIMADALYDGDPGRFRSLQLGVQQSAYITAVERGYVSFRREDGRVRALPPTVSIAAAYRSLFSSYVPSDDTAALDAARYRTRATSRVLDLVQDDARRLLARVGRQDRVRLERHFDEIVSLEDRVRAVPEPTVGMCRTGLEAASARLMDYPDPPITLVPSSFEADLHDIGYANEREVAELMNELCYLAFVCDRTQVISMRYTYAQSFMSVEDLVGVRVDLHQLGHNQAPSDSFGHQGRAVNVHVGWFAGLVEKLKTAPEGDGTVLDSTVLGLMFEGGYGFDPETGTEGSPHSSQNMIALLAGHANIRKGEHIRTDGAHPASVLLSGMRALGHEGGLNEVSATIDGLV